MNVKERSSESGASGSLNSPSKAVGKVEESGRGVAGGTTMDKLIGAEKISGPDA